MPPPAASPAHLLAPETDDAPARPSGRALVPVAPASLPATTAAAPNQNAEDTPPFQDLKLNVDVRKLSPRRMAELGMELYALGALNWDEYALLAFQPELQPDYEWTVGALLGKPAEPDRPRDFISYWEDRLVFEKKYSQNRPHLIDQAKHILSILRMLDVRQRLRRVS